MMQGTPRQSAMLLLGLQFMGYLFLAAQSFANAAYLVALLWSSAALAFAGFLFACWHNWRALPQAAIIASTLFVATGVLVSSSPSERSLLLLAPGLLALILGNSSWLLGCSAVILVALLLRTVGSGVADPSVLIAWYLVGSGGLLLGRMLLDAAHREAENREHELATIRQHVRQQEQTLTQRTRELQQQQAYHQATLDSLNEAVFAMNTAGEWTSLSAAWTAITGFPAAESLQKPLLDFIHPDDRQSSAEQLQRLLEHHQAHLHHEMRCLTSDHDWRWLELRAAWMHDAQGDPVGVRGILRDVTEQKLARTVLAQTHDQPQEIAHLKSEFLATMSHEFRTPMNGIIGMTGMLLETPLNPEQREFADIIRTSANALLGIINDILDFSRIEAGKMVINTTDFELLPVVEGAADVLAEEAREKRIALMTFVSPDIPLRLQGDPAHLRQVLIKLIANAIKFTEKGEIVVRAALEQIATDAIKIAFSVQDTGIGLSDEARAHIFHPFTQVDSSATRKHSGTGLGLAIAQRLIHLMGGTITVESIEKQGTIFTFTLCFEPSSITLPLPTEHTSDQLPDARILIVGGSPMSREIIECYLQTWNLQAATAPDSHAALETLRTAAGQRPYDMVILDLALSNIDGLSLVQTIKQDTDLMTIRLVLLTDSTGHEQGKRALQSGFSAYLTRPVRHAALFEAVSDALADQPQRYPLVMGDFSEPILTDKPAPENQHHLPILLAEDNPVSERIALKQLEKLGCNVHTVSNGREVLTAMSRSSTGYALILMDCQMPEMDGFEATQAIRESELHTGRHIPIIAMTANAMPDDRDICLAIGMDDYISKPVSLETMRMVIDRWMLSPQQKS